MGKNNALAHHTSTFFYTRRVSSYENLPTLQDFKYAYYQYGIISYKLPLWDAVESRSPGEVAS